MVTGLRAITLGALLAGMVLSLGTVPVARAAGFAVNSTADVVDANPGDGVCETAPGNGICTLRAAVQETNATSGDDTITLLAGTYSLTISGLGEDTTATGDLDITDNLTISGAGADSTIIDATGLNDRVFDLPASAVVVEIEGVTITGGQTNAGGGGILNEGGTLTVDASTISGNEATGSGGGIWSSGELMVSASIVSGNTASYPGRGGGIYNAPGGTLTVDASDVYANTANAGGGVFNEDTADIINGSLIGGVDPNTALNGGGIFNYGELTVNASTISDNMAFTDGGGIWGGGELTVGASTVSDNTANNKGGGIWSGGELTVDVSTVSGNTASLGGGIYNQGIADILNESLIGGADLNSGDFGGGIWNSGELTVDASTVSGNTATSYGGAVYNQGTAFILNGSLIGGADANSADSSGGGIYNDSSGTLNVDASTVSWNVAYDGAGIYNHVGGTLTMDASIVSANTANYKGGGIWSGGELTVDASTVSGNSASIGGGIYNQGTADILNGSLIGGAEPNTALNGGGIFNYGELMVDASTVSGNSASSGGGILSVGELTVGASTVSGNTADNEGGGIWSGGELTVDASTVSGNTASIGGGIYNQGTADILNGSLIGGADLNSADFGGGIYNYGELTVDASIVSANTAVSDGGGIYNDSTANILNGSLIGGADPNTANRGGGVYTSGTLTVDASIVSANTANYKGGGIWSNGELTVDASTVSGNSASIGGGIYNQGIADILNGSLIGGAEPNTALNGGGIFNYGELMVDASTVSGNSASSGGGILSVGTASLANSTVSGNSTGSDGGGIYTSDALNLNNVTVAANTADADQDGTGTAGGIYIFDGVVNVQNTILADNIDNGPTAAHDCLGALSSGGYNLIGVTTNCSGMVASDITGSGPLLGPLQDNGGPTFTHALLDASPAIDAGNPATPGSGDPGACEATDQRDIARPQGAACDIGAFESALVNTSVGTDVTVLPVDVATGTSPVTVTFEEVTQEGTTSLTTASTGPRPPDEFKLGDPPIYYDLTTTAQFNGSMEICINFTGITFNTLPPILEHYQDPPGEWEIIPDQYSPPGQPNVVCATVSSFSFFALFEPDQNRPPTADAGGPYTVEEGGSVPLDGSGSDPDGDPLTYEWNLDDDDTYETSGQAPTFSAAGIDGPDSQTVVLRVCDDSDPCATARARVDIRNVAPTVEAKGDSIQEGSTATVTASFTDPGNLDTHTATIDWGDESEPETVPVDQTEGSGSLSASHTYGDDGAYPVTVSVTDDEGATGTATSTVEVGNLPPAASLDTTGAFDFASGEAFLGRRGLEQTHSATASDPGSDDLTFSWSFGATTTTFNDGVGPDPHPSPAGIFPFSAGDTTSVAFDSPGVHSLSVEVTDDDGGLGAASLPKLVTDDRECTRSAFFWALQFRGRRHFRQHTTNAATLQKYLDVLNFASSVYSEQVPASTLEEARELFWGRKRNPRDWAERWLLAAWLNFASGAVGWEELIDTNWDRAGDTPFNQVMAEAEAILLDEDASRAQLLGVIRLASAVNWHDRANRACYRHPGWSGRR